MRLNAPILWLFLIAAIPGCTAISAVSDATRVLDVYELRTPTIQDANLRAQPVEVVLEEPVSSGALATERVMIRPGPFQAQYLPDARWADPAPAMLQTLMVRTLAGTGAFNSVGRRPVGTIGDFAVLSELTDFQAETLGEGQGATIRVSLSIRVVRESDARVVASRTFSVTQAAPNTNPVTLVAAFDAAVSGFLVEFAPWLAARVQTASG